MFLFHISLPLGLLALTGGLMLYIWGLRTPGDGTGLAKVFGLIIIIVTIIELLCLFYWGFKVMEYRHNLMSMQMMRMQNPEMPGAMPPGQMGQEPAAMHPMKMHEEMTARPEHAKRVQH